MFDEYKGDKFEEVLAYFSTTVLSTRLKKEHMFEECRALNISVTPELTAKEQKSLLPLAVAHRASLTNIIKKKETLRTNYRQIQSAIDTKGEELRIKTRYLPTKFDARTAKHARGLAELNKPFDTYWQGDLKWKVGVLEGNKIDITDPILNEPFPKLGSPIIGKTAGEASASHQPSLSEDLEKRIKAQQATVEHWMSLREDRTATNKAASSEPGSRTKSRPTRHMGISLGGFETFQINTDELTDTTFDGPPSGRGSVSEIVHEYEKLTKAMLEKFGTVDRARALSTSRQQGEQDIQDVWDQSESRGSGTLPENDSCDTLGSTSEGSTEAANLHIPFEKARLPVRSHGERESSCDWSVSSGSEILSQQVHVQNSTLSEKTPNSAGKAEVSNAKEFEFPVEKVNQLSLSTLLSPEKRQPSLLERTRKSMALAKAEDYVGSNFKPPVGVPHLPAPVRDSQLQGPNPKLNGRETLVERTRQSMSLLPAKSRAPGTSMLKQTSKAYPTNPFETPKQNLAEMSKLSTPPEELFGQDANYASVFKSRPKIALSPTHSPYVGSTDAPNRSENSSSQGDDVGEELGGSPLGWATRRTGRG